MIKSKIKEIELQIGITDYCNLKCIMCSQTDHEGTYGTKSIKGKKLHKDEKGFMDLNLFKKIINDIIKNKIQFTTISLMWVGESLLHPKFFDILDFMFKKNRFFFFFSNLTFSTNGTLFNRRIADRVITYLENSQKSISIVFSLDVASKKEFINLKGENKFNKTINNITYFIKQKKKFNLSNIIIILQFLVLPENYDEISSFIRNWKKVFMKLNMDFQITSDFYEFDWKKNNFILFKQAYGANQPVLDNLHKRCKIEFNLPRYY